MRKPLTCKINFHQDYIGNRDLDSNIHKGFTVGRGKTLYWEMIWHASSGNVTVYSIESNSWRYLQGDTEITIHFKENIDEATWKEYEKRVNDYNSTMSEIN